MEENKSLTTAGGGQTPGGGEKKNGSGRAAVIAAVAVAAVFVGVAIYLWSRLRTTETEMSEMVEMMTYEKEQLENEFA